VTQAENLTPAEIEHIRRNLFTGDQIRAALEILLSPTWGQEDPTKAPADEASGRTLPDNGPGDHGPGAAGTNGATKGGAADDE